MGAAAADSVSGGDLCRAMVFPYIALVSPSTSVADAVHYPLRLPQPEGKEICMLAKRTQQDQLTLPREIVDLFPDTDTFEVQVESGKIILKPIQPSRLEQVQNKITGLGITEEDIRDAIAWARERKA